MGLSALYAAVLGIPAVVFLVDPRNRTAPLGEFKNVARLSELDVGVPKQVVVRNIRFDSWALHPNDILGRVWLLRRDPATVDAFTTICPHLGGSINYEATKQQFVCPLHGATFDLACRRVSGPAPRDMDALEVRMVPDPASNDAFVEVKYENFVQGREEKMKKV
jgi:menaquinol-cytochrome c reductase iron-sulfur subunit